MLIAQQSRGQHLNLTELLAAIQAAEVLNSASVLMERKMKAATQVAAFITFAVVGQRRFALSEVRASCLRGTPRGPDRPDCLGSQDLCRYLGQGSDIDLLFSSAVSRRECAEYSSEPVEKQPCQCQAGISDQMW